MRTSRWLVIAASALVVSACGSDGSSASKPSASTTSSPKAAGDSGATNVPAAIPAAKSSGCGTAVAVAAGQTKETLKSGGEDRWYYRHVPPAHNGTTPVPLVLDFHGYSEGADVHLLMSKLGPFGDEKGFVTLTPQGTGPVPRWDTTLGSKDLVFAGAMLDAVETQLCIDTNRVYSTGLSNGAFMTSAMACAYSDRIAAAAPVAGVREIKGCTFKRPVPIVAFHGTADGYVSFTGGLGERALDLPAADGSGKKLRDTLTSDQLAKSSGGKDSIPNIMGAWAKRNGCPAGNTEKSVAPDVTEVSYNCPPADATILYRVTDGGHTWPGSEFSQSIASIVGKTTTSVSANAIMWDFFMKHPLRAAH